MWAVSTAYQAAALGSHTRTVRAVMQDPNGTQLLSLYPMGGEVTCDSRRDVRRTCNDLTLVNDPDDDYIPDTGTDTLSPLTDNEVALFRGIVIPSTGVTEEVPLGVFGFDSVVVTDPGDGGITISIGGLADRSRLVTRSRWRTPFVVQPGTALSDAITAGLVTCWPAFPGLTVRDDRVVAALVVYSEGSSSDPWKDLCQLASAHGCELFFDASGAAVLRAFPAPTSADVALTYSPTLTSPVTGITRALSTAEGSYNGVIVSAESTSAPSPYRGEWWDNDDPTSPPARPRPVFYVSPMLTSQAQAQATAQALLPKYLGATELLSWDQVPNCALDAWDLIHVVHAGVKVDAEVLIDAVTYPLAANGSQKITGRSRQVWS